MIEIALLEKYNVILENIKSSVKQFLDTSENREIIAKRQKLNEQQLSSIPFGGLFYCVATGRVTRTIKPFEYSRLACPSVPG